MQLPMTGAWRVMVKAVRPFSIHGDLYWELHVARLDSTGEEASLRVPQHAARSEPVAGQKLSISFLLGQVTAIAGAD